MNLTLTSRARRLAAVAALVASPAVFAQGDACVSASDAHSAQATPGPYAKYLIHLGMSKEQALDTARSVDAGHEQVSEALRRRAEARAEAAQARATVAR